MSTLSQGGCPMGDGLYLKANGELPCWCHVGEGHVLDQVDTAWLGRPDADLIGHPALLSVRQALRDGELPFPDLCRRCPALGERPVPELRPHHLDQLLVEPSYLCGLDCPACLAPKQRLQLKPPPYYLTPELFAATLDRLRADGVRSIRLVHFEGRGDPMLCHQTPELVALARQSYPEAMLQLTTHGSYAFDPQWLDCGLDVLRLSVDGARAESYERYRRGGDFATVLDLMRQLRDHRRRAGSRLRVVWKYVVFEWNDSAEELAEAARLAEELEASLLFVLTDSPGRSIRLPDAESLRQELERVAPRAQLADCRDHLLSAALVTDGLAAEADSEDQLIRAIDALRHDDASTAIEALRRALAHDPGVPVDRLRDEDWLPESLVEHVVQHAKLPSTLSGLANIALWLDRWSAAERLFRRYLQIGPEAADRPQVEDLLIRLALRARLGSDEPADFFAFPPDRLRAAEQAVLDVDPGHRPGPPAEAGDPVDAWADDLLLTLSRRTLGYLRWAAGDFAGAQRLFTTYLEDVPDGPERQPIEWAIDQLAGVTTGGPKAARRRSDRAGSRRRPAP